MRLRGRQDKKGDKVDALRALQEARLGGSHDEQPAPSIDTPTDKDSEAASENVKQVQENVTTTTPSDEKRKKSRMAQYVPKDEKVYDEVSEEEYEKIKLQPRRKRQPSQFVVDGSLSYLHFLIFR